MRSTVAIETVVSRPDFEQSVTHHRCLLVLMRGVGSSKPRSLQRAFERIRRVSGMRVNDASGMSRDIFVRYIHDYPVENNDWGDFQTHRRLLGLLTIGKFDNQTELNELCRLHESLKVRYGSTLYESRAIFFGPPRGGAATTSESLQQMYTRPTNFKTQAFFYNEDDACTDLETHISEFISSLYWVLESKRLERSREKPERVALLLAPFEKREFVGRNMETKSNRKLCVGRGMKQLGDLSLQAGLLEDALRIYHNAAETLRSVADILWTGAAEEGLCATSAMLLYPELRTDEPESNKTTSVPSSPSSLSANSTAGTPTASSSSSSTTTSTISGRNATLPANMLKPEELPTFYRSAICNYSKYRHAAAVQTEAALKASRIYIEQHRPLELSATLQNMLAINISLSDTDRIRRFEVITQLFQQVGFRRKAAFFQRLAALKHSEQNTDWDQQQSYRLMLSSFTGYQLTLDPLEMIDKASGWPALQLDIVQNLITTAQQIGHSGLATRHMTYLLQTQWPNMPTNEQNQLALRLQDLSAKCEGSPVPLVLESGIVIPPANLTDLPYCLDLSIKDLPAHLRPQRIKAAKSDSGPFLFTPIHFNSLDRSDKKKDPNKVAFRWVQNDYGDVLLRLQNPLQFELTVSDMRLLTTGVVFESLPQTIKLQSGVPTSVTLRGKPIEAGELEVQGYSTHTLGVKSNCRLKQMRGRYMPPNYTVDVIPALPRISVKTSLPQTATFSNLPHADTVVTSASLTLYNGESSTCIITLTNDSDLSVEHLEFNINSNVELDAQAKIFRIDETDIAAKLPIAPGNSAEFVLNVFADADFVCTTPPLPVPEHLHNGHATIKSASSAAHASLPSRILSTTSKRVDVNSSNQSSISLNVHNMDAGSTSPQSVQHIEGQFRIKYSGGDAMREDYCRQCAIFIHLELLPSALITGWDVLPAEIPSQFYLVLDVTNQTAQEMTLNYTESKSILIEAKEICRVPIPVERCALEKVYAMREAEFTENMEKELCFRTQPLSFADSINKLCSEHIAERVRIHWSLAGNETSGIASLRGIVLTPAMIDLTMMSPLQWFISFQGAQVQPHAEVSCSAGESVELRVKITNQTLEPLKNLTLTIEFYLDYQNGSSNSRLETCIAISGVNRFTMPVLQKHETAEHVCSLLFFTPGKFKASIQCHSKPTKATSPSSVRPTASGPPLHDTITDITLLLNDVALKASYHEEQEHIWKFIPPIVVNVLE